jgi:sulfate transport system substrate-binding protein
MSWLDQTKRLQANLPELRLFRLRSAEGMLALLLLLIALIYWFWPARPPEALLNIIFDAAQPVFADLDAAWQEQSGVQVSSHHAGSIRQTEALAAGLVADTICVSSAWELDSLARSGRKGLVDENWREQFPAEASPFHSTVVFLVRKGAERRLRDWPDLFEADLRYALPSPDVSGGGRYAYLALAHQAEQYFGNKDWIFNKALDRASFIPHGARRCTEVFLRDSTLDALLTWESEALRALAKNGEKNLAVVYPKQLIRIDPVVAIAREQTEQRGAREHAEDYLSFLFSPEARRYIEIAGFRPSSPEASSSDESELVRVQTLFGSWQSAVDTHLAKDGSYPRLIAYRKARAGGSE